MRLHALDVPLNLRYRGPNEMASSAPYRKGEELGWFEHGSTILLFAPKGHRLATGISDGKVVQMGQSLLEKCDPDPTA